MSDDRNSPEAVRAKAEECRRLARDATDDRARTLLSEIAARMERYLLAQQQMVRGSETQQDIARGQSMAELQHLAARADEIMRRARVRQGMRPTP